MNHGARNIPIDVLRSVAARLEAGAFMADCARDVGIPVTTLTSHLIKAGLRAPKYQPRVGRVSEHKSSALNPIVPPALPDTRDLTGVLFNDPTPAQRAARAAADGAGT